MGNRDPGRMSPGQRGCQNAAPAADVTSRAAAFEPYFGPLWRTLHTPPVGELLDHL